MNFTNPSASDIRDWAYSAEGWPCEEWDSFLSWTNEIDLFIELATDARCAKRLFFLHVLYYLVGTTFTERTRTDRLDRIALCVRKGSGVAHPDIAVWLDNVRTLLHGRMKYNYDDWRGGALAGYTFT